MRSCAFLSMDNLENFECYDHLLVAPLRDRGWNVQEVSWRNKQIDWNRFDAVVIRSPWDYQQDPEAFMDTLREIDRSSALLENSLELVEWNLDKSYLRDLQKRGIEIVPTHWKNHFDEKELNSFFSNLNAGEIIIKPAVSANADDTFRIHKNEQRKYSQTLSEIFAKRPFLVQPFMKSVIEEGEFSVFFFGDAYSHTILKTPKINDFRVQEEHGGQLRNIQNPEKNLLKSARHLLSKLNELPLYSRMDYVRTEQNSFALMELELIEPSLYFNMDPQSPQRFAQVFDEWMNKSNK